MHQSVASSARDAGLGDTGSCGERYFKVQFEQCSDGQDVGLEPQGVVRHSLDADADQDHDLSSSDNIRRPISRFHGFIEVLVRPEQRSVIQEVVRCTGVDVRIVALLFRDGRGGAAIEAYEATVSDFSDGRASNEIKV